MPARESTFGGYSALATFALLSAGEKRQDPRMVRAINFLKTADIIGTYALGVRCQVWYLLPGTPETRRLIAEDATRLMSGMGQNGNATGMWDYLSGPKWVEARKVEQPRFDHSASQYGVLGLWAAADGGAPVPDLRLEDAGPCLAFTPEQRWRLELHQPRRRRHERDHLDDRRRDRDAVHHSRHARVGWRRLLPRQPERSEHRPGIQWIASHWALPNEGYSLFGFERIGAASGLKYLGKHDWYAEGSDFLVKHQREDGSWSMSGTGAYLRFRHELRTVVPRPRSRTGAHQQTQLRGR